MRYPKFLNTQGTIGFVAPAFGCNIEPYRSAFQNAQSVLKQRGYSLKLGPNCYAGKGIGISNTPEACAAEFMEAWEDPDSDVLISCGGGELMCEILEHIDFEALKRAEPKWFMGYSDNTNLTFLLATLCDTASVYGPCAAAFGMEPWHPALEDAFGILTGEKWTVHGYDFYEKESKKDEEHPLEPYHVTEPCRRRRFPDEDAVIEGRLLGGCLDVLANLAGTKYDRVRDFQARYREDGVIWFLEACDLNVLSIRRALWQLKNTGWFEGAKGFLIGRPYCHGETLMGLDQYRAVTDILGELGVPILMDLDIGHIPPMMPLVCGSRAMVRMQGNDIRIDMKIE